VVVRGRINEGGSFLPGVDSNVVAAEGSQLAENEFVGRDPRGVVLPLVLLERRDRREEFQGSISGRRTLVVDLNTRRVVHIGIVCNLSNLKNTQAE